MTHEPGTGLWMWAEDALHVMCISAVMPVQNDYRGVVPAWYSGHARSIYRDDLNVLRSTRGPTDPNELWWVPRDDNGIEVLAAAWTPDGRRIEVEGG